MDAIKLWYKQAEWIFAASAAAVETKEKEKKERDRIEPKKLSPCARISLWQQQKSQKEKYATKTTNCCKKKKNHRRNEKSLFFLRWFFVRRPARALYLLNFWFDVENQIPKKVGHPIAGILFHFILFHFSHGWYAVWIKVTVHRLSSAVLSTSAAAAAEQRVNGREWVWMWCCYKKEKKKKTQGNDVPTCDSKEEKK